MKHLRVLVVDDSANSRSAVVEVLRSLDEVSVVGEAADGQEAFSMVRKEAPDLITLDLSMPRIDGFTFLRILMSRAPTPVIVISGQSSASNVFQALELGALDFVAKPSGPIAPSREGLRRELADKVALVRHLDVSPSVDNFIGQTSESSLESIAGMPSSVHSTICAPAAAASKIAVIAASTGGPTALMEVFRNLSADLDLSIVICQHMPPRFTTTFAERLDGVSHFAVGEAKNGDALLPGTAWVCPGDHGVEVAEDGTLKVEKARTSDRYVPCADRLFSSAAIHYSSSVLGVVLGGMGNDGTEGAKAIADRGGQLVVESAESAVVFGMPGSVLRSGVQADMLDASDIAERLSRFARIDRE